MEGSLGEHMIVYQLFYLVYLCLQSVTKQTEFSLFLQEINIRISKSGISSVMYFCYSAQMGLWCDLTLWRAAPASPVLGPSCPTPTQCRWEGWDSVWAGVRGFMAAIEQL